MRTVPCQSVNLWVTPMLRHPSQQHPLSKGSKAESWAHDYSVYKVGFQGDVLTVGQKQNLFQLKLFLELTFRRVNSKNFRKSNTRTERVYFLLSRLYVV